MTRWRSMCARANRAVGSATVLFVVLVMLLAVVVVVAVEVGAVVAARARLEGIADHAALAAAGAAVDTGHVVGDSATQRAARVAAANGARLDRCDCDAVPVEVTVARTVTTPLGLVSGLAMVASAEATVVPQR